MERVDTIIIWLNYNSSRIQRVMLESLKSVAELDYGNHMLLVLDNGSTDGSLERIKQFIDSNAELHLRTKVIERG